VRRPLRASIAVTAERFPFVPGSGIGQNEIDRAANSNMHFHWLTLPGAEKIEYSGLAFCRWSTGYRCPFNGRLERMAG